MAEQALNKARKTASKVSKAMDVVDAGADKATNILEGGLEVVADVVPDTLDAGVHVATGGVRAGTDALTNPKRLAILLAVGGAALGAGAGVAGYFLLKKRLEKKFLLEFEERMDKEVENIRLFYAKRNKGEGYETPADAAVAVGAPVVVVATEENVLASEAGDAAAEYAGDQPPVGIQPSDPRQGKNTKTPYHQIKVTKPSDDETVVEVKETTEPIADEPVTRNVFEARRLSGWDQEHEEATRIETLPYVISIQEHNDNLFEHEQNTLTYYVPDDMLLDERDEPVEDVDGLVGVENLGLFGHGSGSPDTLYIRNEVKEMDLEIIRRTDSYAEVIFSRDSG